MMHTSNKVEDYIDYGIENVKVGERVGTLIRLSGDTLYSYGYGIYLGNFIPVKTKDPHGSFLKKEGIKSAKILLDSGKVVYGYKCFWDSETYIKRLLSGFKVEIIEGEENYEDPLP